jgi:hypothetical protein
MPTSMRSQSRRGGTDSPYIGLIVATPFCSTRSRIEQVLRTRAHPELRLISLGGILRMADLVAADN